MTKSYRTYEIQFREWILQKVWEWIEKLERERKGKMKKGRERDFKKKVAEKISHSRDR